MICAGHPNGGVSACFGDDGGPLICQKDGNAVLTGVVSISNGCGHPEFPGIYARIMAVLDWVKANMVCNMNLFLSIVYFR